jgi:hypothetical protein
MAFEESKWVWMDGDLIPWLNATTHVSAHAPDGLYVLPLINPSGSCSIRDTNSSFFQL